MKPAIFGTLLAVMLLWPDVAQASPNGGTTIPSLGLHARSPDPGCSVGGESLVVGLIALGFLAPRPRPRP